MQVINLNDNMVPSAYDETDRWVSADQYHLPIPAQGSPHDPDWKEAWVELRMYAKYTRHVERFSVLYQGPGGSMRVEHGGPEVAGPLGCLIAQSVIIANTPIPQPHKVYDVAEGDVLVINGQRMVIVDDRPRTNYPRLVTELEAGMIEAVRRIADRMQEHMAAENQASDPAESAQHKAAWMLLSDMARDLRARTASLRAAYRD